jgi:hypothetical protein
MSFPFIQQAYAQCAPGSTTGSNLGDCLLLNTSGDKVADKYDTVTTIVNPIVANVFIFGGIILFVMVFYAGFKFISGGSKAKDEARTMLTTAIIGMIIMFIAYWIVQIVKYVTGTNVLI